ncbi:MAG TPA: glycosyl hydrolase family 65 protein [Clostridia bacterium]|nr:glycosyl hydrolase family 65 protein [Clostridia bacterium]
MLKYDRGIGEYKDWILSEDKYDSRYQSKCESIMALGNGYLGVRSALEETYVGQTRNFFVAGTFNRFHPNEVTELPNAADFTEMQIYLDSELFTMDTGKVKEYVRYLNLKEAELTREVMWESPEGRAYRLVFRRFVSLEDLHLTAFKLSVTPMSEDARIRIRTGIDGRMTNSGSQHFSEGEKRVYEKKIMQLVQTTTESQIDFVLNCGCSVYEADNPVKVISEAAEYGVERRKIYGLYEFTAKKDVGITFEKLVAVFTSRDRECTEGYRLEKLRKNSLEHLKNIMTLGYDELFAKSRDKWSRYWNSVNIEVVSSNSEDMLAVRFAQYHLLIAAPVHDDRFSIGAKGLTGEGYKAHVFWDTEMFMLPYFQYNLPDIARQLLYYRYNNLEGARKKARQYGYEGAMYPWEAAFTGEEETPEWAALNVITGKPTRVWAGIKEHHITADVAYMVWQYYLSAGDSEFMEYCGYEMIFECAWFWCSRISWNEGQGRYEIIDVIGPDEYTEHIDNNAYTNYIAHYVISTALKLFDMLHSDQPALFLRLDEKLNLSKRYGTYRLAAARLYLPKAGRDGVIPQDDTFLGKKEIDINKYRYDDIKQSILLDYSRRQIVDMQVLKQADVVMLLCTLRKLFDKETIKASFEYYEKRTIHDSSLSSAIHSIAACYFDNTVRAYSFFRDACNIDMGQNPVSSNTGIHAAAMGGIWMAAVMGFGGLFSNEGQLELNPVLPEEWARLCYGFCWHGRRIRVEAARGTIVITSSSHGETCLKVYGQEYKLRDRLVIDIDKEEVQYGS